MSAAHYSKIFLWCKCQMKHSNKMKIWHSNCHLCICTCRFVLFLLLLIDTWFLTICVTLCSIWTRTSWPVFSREHLRMSGDIGSKSIIHSALGCFRLKCMVTFSQPSSSENKERSSGSSHHKAALQGHWTRRQQRASCCESLCWKIIFASSASVCLFRSCVFDHIQKKTLSEGKISNSWASQMTEKIASTCYNMYLTYLQCKPVIWQLDEWASN